MSREHFTVWVINFSQIEHSNGGEIIFLGANRDSIVLPLKCQKSYTRLNAGRAENHEKEMVASASHVLPPEYISRKEVKPAIDCGICSGT